MSVGAFSQSEWSGKTARHFASVCVSVMLCIHRPVVIVLQNSAENPHFPQCVVCTNVSCTFFSKRNRNTGYSPEGWNLQIVWLQVVFVSHRQ